ncbi:MAG: SprT-like domain-containing protein [Planctomycetota bacterium]|nr:SprT-like domain-containing protein [Planctomycetota bacterium]
MLSPAILDRESRRAFDAVKAVLGLPRWPRIPIRWNRRLRRAGRAIIEMPAGGFQSAVIELSPAYFAVYPGDLYGILVHEAVHVGLAILDEPFGHDEGFRRACLAAGGLLHSRWLPGRVYVYRCPLCEGEVERRRPASESRWCADCADEAEAAGADAYAADRALVLVRTEFRGPEAVDDKDVTIQTGGEAVCTLDPPSPDAR